MANFKRKDPQYVSIKGKALECPVCGNKRFWNRRILLNTSAATFFDLDWANRKAICYICSDCNYIYWFHQ